MPSPLPPLDSSPEGLLRRLCGEVLAARIAYPDVLRVEVRDARARVWRLATQYAEWTPADPHALVGESVKGAEIDTASQELRLVLSGGSTLHVIPGATESPEDLPNWELLAPDGLVLEFGPGMCWRIAAATGPAAGR